MKTKIALLITVASLGSANAALYTLNNGSGSTAAGIQTLDGSTFRSGVAAGNAFTGTNLGISAGSGVVSFGFFSTDDFSTTSTSADLVSLFTRFGAEGTFAAGSTGGNRSVFSSPQNQTIGTTFNDKHIYLFVGNASSYLASTEFLVAKFDTKFAVADDTTNAVTPKLLTINPGNSQVLIGSEIANVWTTNTDASTTAGWQMAVLVPEPSSALLGAIGALGLLRRRRN
jgi:hypothetical protein